jgi:hypothetical protein
MFCSFLHSDPCREALSGRRPPCTACLGGTVYKTKYVVEYVVATLSVTLQLENLAVAHGLQFVVNLGELDLEVRHKGCSPGVHR